MATVGSGGASAPPPNARAPPPAEATPLPDEQYRSQLPLDNVVFSTYKYIIYLFVNYGWHILFAVIILAVLWTNIKPALMRWLKKREERFEEANFDPDKAERYQDGMLRAREKMQRELEEKARQHQELMEEKEAKERDDRIKQWEEFKVVTKSNSSKAKPSSRDYFPMSGGGGGGGGGGYRPQRRTLGGRGGG